MKFYSPVLGSISKDEMIEQIKKFVSSDPKSAYKIVIGTDSQTGNGSQKTKCQFVTAIIVHRIGNGAKFYWSRQSVIMVPVLRNKIYQETTISLDFAKKFIPKLRDELNGAKYDFEIHIDVGNTGPTREMIKEVVGMVTGHGLIARTKPQSWGASSVADRYT